MTLLPQAGGKFEIEVDGELVYSKLTTGSFPDEGSILQLLRERS
jgi:selT/selW/selH-like putative selenoprotein